MVAVDDPAASTVDYTSCPDQKPAGAPLDGKWVKVPGANLRMLAVCSEHPDQIGPIHYGAGDVDEEACTPPSSISSPTNGSTSRSCASTYDHVDDASLGPALTALAPRYALGGHWEDFFVAAGSAPQPIPFLDVPSWGTKASAALPVSTEPLPLLQNGKVAAYRTAIPQPGDSFEIMP